MQKREAAEIVAFLNASFHRDALEPETAAIWVSEMMELANAEAGRVAARTCGRNGDRFPTLKEFRHVYRGCVERLAPPALETPSPERGEVPAEAREMLDRLRHGTLLRSMG